MGIKDLFFEREEPSSVTEGFVPESSIDYANDSIEAPDNDTVAFVEDVYSRYDLMDVSKSIFKVEELAGTLPSEMPNDIKRQTVLSIMTTVGLSAEGVINDGYQRLQYLESARGELESNLNSEIQENENSIESLKVQISELQKNNSMKRSQIISINDAAIKEIDRIKGLMGFLGTSSIFEQEDQK